MAADAPRAHELIWFRRLRGRRGPQPTLSRDQITRAAVELADAEGIEGVSMRKLAAKLGAGATSLYWHVQSKDDLHELMVDEVIGEVAIRTLDPLALDLSERINALAALNIAAYLGATDGEHDDLAAHMAPRFRLVSRESFEFGLDCVLEGVAARISPRPRTRRAAS